MDYIPSFVARKQGQEAVEYDLPEMEEFLKDTYGVTVYQEQVMLLSQKLANFTKGEADKLRKAMGKKQIDILNSLKEKFMTGGMKNGHPEKTLDKIWKDWEKFAQYAFNKSHATCYAWVSYQTGWLKAHYPAEFQAANLSNNLSKMDEIKKIMDDCKKGGIKVLNPDINESHSAFSVNTEGHVRFGLGGIKGFGSNIVQAIISERTRNGQFADIYDFIERMSGVVNRKSMESLIYSGAFESFHISKQQFFTPCRSGDTFLDALIRYGELFRRDAENAAISLFGEAEEMKPTRPEIPEVENEVDDFIFLQKEKELVGMYLSAHPLDKYRFELDNFVGCSLGQLDARINECTERQAGEKVCVAGLITETGTFNSKTGRAYSKTRIEDYEGSFELALFGKDHEAFMAYLLPHTAIWIDGEIKPRFYQKPAEGASAQPQQKIPYGFRVNRIVLLGNVAEEKVKNFTIQLSTPQLTPEFRERLVQLIKDNKGPIPLSMKLYDPVHKWNIEFACRKFTVGVNNDFVSTLEAMGLSYDVEKKR